MVSEKRKLEDRPRHEMWEHRDEAGKIDEVHHCLGVPAKDVNGVAEGLEGVEADAKRQHHLQRGMPLPALLSNIWMSPVA